MNSTIAESLNNNSGLEDEAIKYKNYLNNLKRNYLENLTLTSPQTNKQQQQKSVVKDINQRVKHQQQTSPTSIVKRKISFPSEKRNPNLVVSEDDDDDDNNKDESSLSLRDHIAAKSKQKNKIKIHDQHTEQSVGHIFASNKGFKK